MNHVASSFLDALLLAGGLSVPTTLEYMLGLYFTSIGKPASIVDIDLTNNATLFNYMMETFRRYAPVAGVPRWVKNAGETTWHHEIPIVAQAFQDPKYFPNPKEFQPGRPGINAKDMSKS